MKRQLIPLAVVAAFTFCAPLAMAQSAAAVKTAPVTSATTNAEHATAHKHNMMKRERMRMRHHRMMGRHMMPSTIHSVDHKTGIVDLTSLGMRLRVHFPPPTITELKAGDKINLMLGYRMENAPKTDKPTASKTDTPTASK